jgi:hypothetical protein
MIKKLYPIVCLLLICGIKLHAQVAAWGGGADYEDYGFGFHFSYIGADFRVLKAADWRTPYFYADAGKNITDSLSSITSASSAGFGVGFLARLRITDNLEVRITPGLSFSDRKILYQYKTPDQNVEKTISAALAEIPLQLKLKSDRIGDIRMYLIGGAKYSYNISGPKKEDANTSPLEKMVNNNRSYLSYEAGVGCDIYFSYFKFSPEIKFSNTFKNILTPGDNPYSKPLDQLFLHTLVFSIYFE